MSNKRHLHRKPPGSLPRTERMPSKRSINRRIIAQGQTNLYEYSLHATKGYRARSLRGVEI